MALNSTAELVRSLEKAVGTAFFRAGLRSKELLQGPIDYTDLPWQCPPLKSEVRLEGVPLEAYMTCAIPVTSDRVHEWWHTSLRLMYHYPKQVITADGSYRNLNKVFGNATQGQHRLRFSTPEGLPSAIDPYSGLVFSLEVADALMNSTVWVPTRTENDYYVESPQGLIGVRKGLPIGSPYWDTDCSGMIYDFMSLPRGKVTTKCLYDPLAKVRSLFETYRRKFREPEGVEQALQALRFLYKDGTPCRILTGNAVLAKPVVGFETELKQLKSAKELMARDNFSDRAKVNGLYALLVPDVISDTGFNNTICSVRTLVPYTLRSKSLDRINDRLSELEEKFLNKEKQ